MGSQRTGLSLEQGGHVESPGMSLMAFLKSLGGSHMSLGVWLKLMPSQSGTSSPRVEPPKNTLISLVIKMSILLGNLFIRIISNSKCSGQISIVPKR